MEENKRVYPRSVGSRKWINYLLLFLSVVLVLSGLLWRKEDADLQLSVAATPTPIPTDEAFDETMESRELVLPSCSWYALQLGAFENEEAAAQVAQDYQTRGAAGYVWHDSKFRAMAALYDSKEDAQAVRTQLSQKRNIEAYPYEISLRPLTLRMRGMKGQLDILEAAFLHGHDLVKQLQERSVLLDRQEAGVEETLQALQSASNQMQNVSIRLFQRFPAPRHAAVQALIDLFDHYAAFCQGVNANATSVQLATEIKYQALEALYGLTKIYDGLGNT